MRNIYQIKITFSTIAHDWIFWITFLFTFTALAKVLSICAISATHVLRKEREYAYGILFNEYKNVSLHFRCLVDKYCSKNEFPCIYFKLKLKSVILRFEDFLIDAMYNNMYLKGIEFLEKINFPAFCTNMRLAYGLDVMASSYGFYSQEVIFKNQLPGQTFSV